MINQNLFMFLDKYTNKTKKSFIKKNSQIKIYNRSMKTTKEFIGFNLAIHNGLFFLPVYVDLNKINHMLAIFSFSFSIKLKKKIKIYKKKKKKK